MELYNFYQLVATFMVLFGKSKTAHVLWGAPIGAALWVVMFLLQGVGLYVMAKRLGMKKRALAFVPFVNIYYLGKIVGECSFFGHRMKNAGLYTMIAQILATLVTAVYISAEWYLYFKHGAPVYPTDDMSLLSTPQWQNLSGFSKTVYNVYFYGEALLSIVGLVAMILMLILLVGLYKKYSPRNYRFLGILSFFLPETRFIAIFVLRNRQAIDYEAYMRRQREEYIRRQQQYYNNYGNPYNQGYNNPYGNGYGSPYGQNGYPQQGNAPTQTEEPFGEFSSRDKASGGEKDENSDGFFD